MKFNRDAIRLIVIIVVSLGFLLSSCNPRPTAGPTLAASATLQPTDMIIPTSGPTATATPVPLPLLTLKQGDAYFSLNSKPAFIFSRNLAGFKPDDYTTLLNWAHTGGTLLVRVGTDNSSMGGDWGYGYTNNGEINDGWSNNWEHFFDEAETNGIYVLPFFTGWENWNTSLPNTWAKNPFNSINGGPTKDPTEIFRKDSPTQELYLEWFKKVVTRWQKHKNIAAWEVITEVNNINGITEPDGVYLFNQLAGVARAADPQQRPISASLADIGKGDWTSFYGDKALDILDYHPYPYTPTLDLSEKLLSDTARLRMKYNKPIIIGESGLNALLPDDKSGSGNLPNAQIGIEHAIWTEIVSGTMNGRALFWEDSFGMYFTSLGWPYLQKYKDIERSAANFANGVDFSGFQPLKSAISSGIWGATIGNEKMALGWYRDASSTAPNWNMKPVVSKQAVTVTVPGKASNWKVVFYNTKDGSTILGSVTVSQTGSTVTIPLPDFQDDIAFKMTAGTGTGTVPTLASATGTETGPTPSLASTSMTDPIAGTWNGTISNLAGTFSTSIKLSIRPGCRPGKVCGTFSAPNLPCSGDLFLQNITAATFLFQEQNVSGAASCLSGGFEQLQLMADGTISYGYLTSPGSAASSTGILKHP